MQVIFGRHNQPHKNCGESSDTVHKSYTFAHLRDYNRQIGGTLLFIYRRLYRNQIAEQRLQQECPEAYLYERPRHSHSGQGRKNSLLEFYSPGYALWKSS